MISSGMRQAFRERYRLSKVRKRSSKALTASATNEKDLRGFLVFGDVEIEETKDLFLA